LLPPPGINSPCDLSNKNSMDPSLMLYGIGMQLAPAASSQEEYETGVYGNIVSR